MLDQQNWKLSEEKSVVVSLFFHSSSAKVLRRDLYLIAFLPDCRKLTRSRSVQCFNCVGIKSATNKTSYYIFDELFNEKKQSYQTFWFKYRYSF